MKCPSCGNTSDACPVCEGNPKGIPITGCPQEQVSADVWTLMERCGDAEMGHLPVSGGVEEQAEAFLQGRRVVNRLKNLRKNHTDG